MGEWESGRVSDGRMERQKRKDISNGCDRVDKV